MEVTSFPVLYFDGVCNLCNGFIGFIIRHDKKMVFHFASLQSPHGIAALAQFHGTPPDSVILFRNGRYYTRSAAVLQTFSLLGGGWKLLLVAWIIPGFLRDAIYDLISRNRYKWLGKRNECMVPAPELMSRFL